MNNQETCINCGHKKSCFTRGFCHHSEPGEHGIYCGCECKIWKPPFEFDKTPIEPEK